MRFIGFILNDVNLCLMNIYMVVKEESFSFEDEIVNLVWEYYGY